MIRTTHPITPPPPGPCLPHWHWVSSLLVFLRRSMCLLLNALPFPHHVQWGIPLEIEGR